MEAVASRYATAIPDHTTARLQTVADPAYQPTPATPTAVRTRVSPHDHPTITTMTDTLVHPTQMAGAVPDLATITEARHVAAPLAAAHTEAADAQVAQDVQADVDAINP